MTSPNTNEDNSYHWSAGEQAVKLVAVVLFCVGVPVVIHQMLTFYSRIGTYPIKDRTPRMVLLGDLVLLIFYVVTCVRGFDMRTFPCWLFYWSRLMFVGVCLSVYVVRLFYVLYKYELTVELAGEWTRSTLMQRRQEESRRRQSQQMVADQERQPPPPQAVQQGSDLTVDRVGVFSRHRYLLRDQNIVRIALCILFIITVPGAIVFATNSSFSEVESGRCLNHAGDLYNDVLLCVVFSIFIVLAWRMREVIEGYRLVFEFKCTSIGVVFWFILWQIMKRVQSYFPFHTVCAIMLVLTVIVCSTTYPIWLSRRHEMDGYQLISSQSEAIKVLGTLEGVLRHPEMKELFKEHLCREFSIENLFFLDEIATWKQRVHMLIGADYFTGSRRASVSTAQRRNSVSLVTPTKKPGHIPMTSVSRARRANKTVVTAQLWETASHIFDLFVEVDAPYQVNVPHPIRIAIGKALHTVRGGYESSAVAAAALDNDNIVNNSSSSYDLRMIQVTLADGDDDRPMPPVDIELFDNAEKSIYDLLQRDSFPRFIQTVEARQLLREILKQKKIEGHYSEVSTNRALTVKSSRSATAASRASRSLQSPPSVKE